MAFLPHLIASGDAHLVNISSLFGLIPIPTQSAYVASKFAVRGFTESLRIEMLAAKMPLKVTCVHPGGVNTAIARSGTRNAAALQEDALEPRSATSLLRMPPEKAAHHHPASHVPRPSSRARWRSDARAAYLLSSLSRTGWQSLAALSFGRMSEPRSRPGATGPT